MEAIEPNNRLITREEAARLLGGVSVRTLDKLCLRREIDKIRVGSRAMIRLASIERYIDRQAGERPE